jgi:hypothetical protein
VSDFDSLAESAFCTLSLLLLLHAKTKGSARKIIALFFIIFIFLIKRLISKRIAENFMPVKKRIKKNKQDPEWGREATMIDEEYRIWIECRM